MELLENIDRDLTEAMKAQDEVKTSTLRLLKSAIHNWQIAAPKNPQDADVLGIILKEIKSRHDSIEMFKKGNREELAKKEEAEIAILQVYLPKQMSEEDIRSKIKDIITKVGAQNIQDMGKVMGPVMAELKGKADGSMVSSIVKEELSK